LAITALGAGFFAGLKATSPDMRATADHYYGDGHLMDLRVLSTLGLTQADVEILAARPDVEAVMAGWGMDALTEHPEGDQPARLNALPYDTSDDNPHYLNRPTVTEGRMPLAADECLVDASSAWQVGDVITLSAANSADALDLMLQHRFTVVGRATSPAYVSFFRGNTNIGDGRVVYFAYLHPDAFDQEVYTDVYLRLAGSGAVSSFSDAYDDLIDTEADALEVLGEARAQVRYDEVKAEGEAELADARQKLADARQEVADGEVELIDGRQELEDARAEADEKLADAWQQILDGEAEIANGWSEVRSNEQKLADADAQIAGGDAALATARAQLQTGWAEYDTGEKALDKQTKTWRKGRDQYDAGKAAYDAGLAAWEAGQAAWEAGAAQVESLNQAVAGIGQAVTGLEGLLQQVAAGTPGADVLFEQTALEAAAGLRQIAAGLAAAGLPGGDAMTAAAQGMEDAVAAKAYDVAYGTLAAVPAALQPGLDAAAAELAAGKAELDAGKATLDESNATLQAAKAELDAGKKALDAGTDQLKAARAELDAGEAAVAENAATLDAARAQVADGRSQLKTAKTELADAERKLADGKAEYAEQKAEAEEKIADAEVELADGEAELADARQKLADAEEEIADGQRRLDELEVPEWYVRTREANPGYSGFASDTNRIDSIAVVIPVFFFLVAALVCLTSMTRMVEEQRMMIGTLKALGYGRASIAAKYVGYAAIASIAGAVLGVVVGFIAFPSTIWQAYSILYIMPPIRLWDSNQMLAAVSILVSVLCTTLATLAACINELRSVPAELLRPKAPRAGKRVLLERIGPLWRRLSFMMKVTARNLFRYKKRFFMTVIGVAGCTALLLTGFGLRDSISGIVSRQYGGINLYDLIAVTADPSTAEADTPLNALLPKIGTGIYLQEQLIEAESDAGSSNGLTVYIDVAEAPERLAEFVHFEDRTTGVVLDFPQEGGVVITEKLADRLKLKAGDTFSINFPNEKPVTTTVAAVMENYVMNHIYATPRQYEALFGKAPAYDTVLINQSADSALDTDQALNTLLETDGVAGASDIAGMKARFDDMFSSLDAVVWLIILAAGLLAFVVLYNLTNINITERGREIATLEVLGFYNGEVASYVYRENLILTGIGIAVGLVLGVYLHQFVITAAEVDEVMFRRVVEPLSYLWAVLFTFGCAMLVNLVMLPRLRKVDMVESLKAAE